MQPAILLRRPRTRSDKCRASRRRHRKRGAQRRRSETTASDERSRRSDFRSEQAAGGFLFVIDMPRWLGCSRGFDNSRRFARDGSGARLGRCGAVSAARFMRKCALDAGHDRRHRAMVRHRSRTMLARRPQQTISLSVVLPRTSRFSPRSSIARTFHGHP